ncbi:hypothetical protein VitviT2T_009677 [Vitis vinifera]|uniref:Short-chain dehydrogenase reductase 3b n=1 Tax=Vitis vinifera TaxID=29760 RepID=A0ABY9C5K5_VITVI|nr:hypothetical protein VitviT2T_009677 [Vitis vinifera]
MVPVHPYFFWQLSLPAVALEGLISRHSPVRNRIALSVVVVQNPRPPAAVPHANFVTILHVSACHVLEGKVAIITGAASGIGEAAAKLFAENGAFVVIADIQDELGHQVVASIGPEKSSYFHCNVRDERQVEETVAYAIQKYGTLDIMFSNAAITGPIGSILEMDMDGFDDTIATNFRGPASTIKHAARAMVEKQVRGSIICTGSVSSTLGGSGPPAYTASKHAVLGLVRSAADDLGQYGIRVNCVSPFAVATRMSTGMYNVDASIVEASASSFSQLKGIILKPRHVAEAALFLASDESAYVTGHNLAVDGGVSVLSTTRSRLRK